MANEPERLIEKLLHAAAQKRRDEAGAPLTLHPANRRLLQSEVARKYARPQPEPRSFAAFVAQLWPRLAGAAAILAVLGMLVWLLVPAPRQGKPEMSLALNQPSSERGPARELPPPAPVAPATVAPAPASAARSQPAVAAYDGLAQGAPAAAATKPAGREEPFSSETALVTTRGSDKDSSGMPAAAPMVAMADESEKVPGDKFDQPSLKYKSLATAASADRVNRSPVTTGAVSANTALGLKQAEARAAGQRFVQVAAEAKATYGLADRVGTAQPVLASFHVEQAGQQLRIVDADGSVYSGSLQLADAARRARTASSQASASAPASRALGGKLEESAALGGDAAQLASHSYSFSVAGTNRSLNKQVVFTGNLLTATNLTLALQPTNLQNAVAGFAGASAGPAQRGSLPLLNSRIAGKVVIGTGKPVEINALPTSP